MRIPWLLRSWLVTEYLPNFQWICMNRNVCFANYLLNFVIKSVENIFLIFTLKIILQFFLFEKVGESEKTVSPFGAELGSHEPTVWKNSNFSKRVLVCHGRFITILAWGHALVDAEKSSWGYGDLCRHGTLRYFVSISILPKVVRNTKYFPDRQTILPNLQNNTSQHIWIVINTSESQNGVKLDYSL